MEQSRRAVESYRRSRMIDGATSDEDKVTPVYKLEEICELLRSSSVGIVKEVSEFVLKRLEHKSPVVKQKALRLIKYCIGKSGVEFKREMQRHSIAVRQLLLYKGQLDPLKGDAPNKAVRETAQEVMNAIFSTEENKPSPSEDISRRIQGFGNTSYEPPSEDKKSFLSEVVDFGSVTIKHRLGSFTQGNSFMKNETGSFKSPNLRRSLTTGRDFADRYESVAYHSEQHSSFGISKNQPSGPWNQDSRVNKLESTNGNANATYTESKTCEERLLETIVTLGGVRLQPTRDAIQVFLSEAIKLDALALSHAVEVKLQSPMWQVRMKAVCVLEAILRRKDDEKFFMVWSYFYENKDVVVKCSESPQASLREKANKVLSLLVGEQTDSGVTASENPARTETIVTSQMPDLIDTSDVNDHHGIDDTASNKSNQCGTHLTSSAPLIDDLFGDGNKGVVANYKPNNDDDPFADVSFYVNESKDNGVDILSGLNLDNQRDAKASLMKGNKSGPELFDMFGPQSELPKEQGNSKEHVANLVAGLSINENTLNMKQKAMPSSVHPDTLLSNSKRQPVSQVSNNPMNAMFSSQNGGVNASSMLQTGNLAYNMPPGTVFSPNYPQPLNYAAMGSLLAQQQILASMVNFQQHGNGNQQNSGVPCMTGPNGGYSSPFPDIFQSNILTQTPTSTMSSSKKEETRAFDFVSDHLAAARDPKRVV